MKSYPSVSVVVINYNGKRYLKNCFDSLYRINYPKTKLEIIMVDNGSSDGSLRFVRGKYPKVKILRNDINNYCRANNLGIRKAKGQFIAVLNNDTKIDKDWLIELMKVMNTAKSIAAVGSKILFTNGRIESIGHIALRNFYWQDKGSNQKDHGQFDKLEKTSSLCGCSVLYRKKALKDVDYFDEDFNMYLEDVDISMRLKKKGWQLLYAPKSLVFHKHHGTSRGDLPAFYTERNRLILVAKHYPQKLSSALVGRGYFTVHKDLKSQTNFYQILLDLVLKLIKHHKTRVTKRALAGLFNELKKASHHERSILLGEIENLSKGLQSNQGLIQEKEKYIGILSSEINKRDFAIKEKEDYANSLDLEIHKRDEAIQNKDDYLVSLETEVKRQHEEAKNKDQNLRSLDLEIHKRDEAIKKKDDYLVSLEAEVKKQYEEAKNKDQHLKDLSLEVNRRDQLIQDKDKYANSLVLEIGTRDGLIQGKDSQLKSLGSEIEKREKLLKDKDEYLNSLNLRFKELDDFIKRQDDYSKNLNLEIQKKEYTLQEKDIQLNNLNSDIENKNKIIKDKDNEICVLTRELNNVNLELNNKSELINEKETNLKDLNLQIAKLDNALQQKEQSINILGLEVNNISQAIKEKDTYINSLSYQIKRREQELNDVYTSTAFRYLVKPLWTMLWEIKQIARGNKSSELLVSRDACPPLEVGAPGVDTGQIGICTIISKNYLAYARVLADSYLKYNKGRVFVLLTDYIDGYFDPNKENFTLIEVDQIKHKIPDFDKFCFQYNLTELNTAVKPFFLEFLFEHYGLKKLVFFDPDILITNNLNELFCLLDKYSIVLIPHITQPYKDTHKPNECDILRSGVYNLGFIALSDKNSTGVLLRWWQERLNRYCKVDLERGLFVDQKWIDLIPGFFEDVFILRDHSYNIAYWNFHYRKVYIEGSRFLIDNKPVNFLHFSGVQLDNINSISKHQDRYLLKDIKHMSPIFDLYKEHLMSHGYEENRSWPCHFTFFDNGISIPDAARKIYWEAGGALKSKFGNPFDTTRGYSFLKWLNEDADTKKPSITRLMLGIYDSRPDVKRIYPDVFNFHRKAFSDWFFLNAKQEYMLEDIFLSKIYANKSERKLVLAVNLRIKIINIIRNFFKKYLKILFRNNLKMISNLKSMEMRLWSKVFNFSKLYSKDSVYAKDEGSTKGVNIWGYLTAEVGVGECARANIRCLEQAGVGVSLLNIPDHSYSRQNDHSFSRFSSSNPYYINLIHVNADMFSRLYVEKGKGYFENKYNIGVWNWELSDFPDEWLEGFSYCNEIWTPSSFSLAAIARKSPVPVIKMPISVSIDKAKDADRMYFGLNDYDFIFLFVFDFLSYFERKNPLAVIKAFKEAFSPLEKVRLVIKCCNQSFDPAAMKVMNEVSRGHNINIIEGYFTKEEINTLMALCDSYVSLHRSEGFGLTMAEAMYLGKPVIATGYSGNTDFMNVSNSYLVKYRLTDINRDIGPYRKGKVWAEPDIQHAAELMRCVYEKKELSLKVGKIAQEDVRKNLNFNVIGKEIKSRINYILAVNNFINVKK
ncbi:MAG: glycosyltransferase [Candidatus Omnitrophota bacterium]